MWCLGSESNQQPLVFQTSALTANELPRHMYRWLPGLKPTTLLDLCTPKTIHKLTPWREVRESDSRLQFCRLAYEPLYELPICIGPGGGTQTLVAGATILHFNPLNYSWDILVGEVGFEPTQPKALDLQSSPTLPRWRSPIYVWRQSEVSIPIRLTPNP